MSLTYHERHLLSSDPTWIGRCRQAALKYSLYVAGSVSPDPNDVALLKAVLNNPEHYAELFADAASMNDFVGTGGADDPVPDTAAGDAKLSSVIEGSVWAAFALEV